MQKRIGTEVIATIMAVAVMAMGLIACADKTPEKASEASSVDSSVDSAPTEASTTEDASSGDLGSTEATTDDSEATTDDTENKIDDNMDLVTIKDLMNNPDFDVENNVEIRMDKVADIMNESYTVTCKKCGKEVCSCSTEIVRLPEDYSEGASKINEYMQKIVDELESYSVETVYLECGSHPTDYPGMYFNNDVIDSVNVINDKYLTVDISSSCAIGGASKFYTQKQLLFDLTTGDKLTFKDFFKGSDDDFRKIVKEKYGDESSLEIADWVIKDGDSHIAFRDDAVVLFATKFDLTGASDPDLVEYEFTYQEMLGTDTLTR